MARGCLLPERISLPGIHSTKYCGNKRVYRKLVANTHCLRGLKVVPQCKSDVSQSDLSLGSLPDEGGNQNRIHPAVAHSGSVLGAVALITGSSVGAGMLAIPAVSAASGYIPSAAAMIGSWVVLVLEALLLVEVNLAVVKKRKARGDDPNMIVSLRSMAAETLGPAGGQVTSIVYLFMSYTLLVAFIAKGGETLNLATGHLLPPSLCGLAFAASLGGLVHFGSPKTIDFTNQILTAVLMTLFGALIMGGGQSANWSSLCAHQDWSQVGGALPIIFLSLVYHDLIPYVCKYLGFDKCRIQKAVILGGTTPLFMFLAWDAVALALVPAATDLVHSGGHIDPLRLLIETQGGAAGLAIEAFTMFALITSFVGTVLGMSDYMHSEVQDFFNDIPDQNNIMKWVQNVTPGSSYEDFCRTLGISIVLIPPALAAFMYPHLFFVASQIAGAYGITLLYGIIPPMMAWCVRHPSAGVSTRVQSMLVPGGRPVLVGLTSAATAFEIGKFSMDSGQFLNGLTDVGSHMQTAANMVVSELAAVDGIAQIGHALQLPNLLS